MTTSKLLGAPDDLEVESGSRGERMVARVRLWIVLLLAPIPLVNAIDTPHWENFVGAGVIGIALLLAFNIHQAVERDPQTPGIGVVSTAADVSLITLALATFLVYGEPLTATNSMVVFEAYFLAIAATALRQDTRLSLLAGALAVAQYALIVILAVVMFDLTNDGVFSSRYGSFSWGTQISRMILLAVAASIATIVVLRQSDLLHRSSIDSLTLLYNRGALTERLEMEVTRSRRHSHPLSIAMIDIDHFKQINDGHGHAAGDEALRQFADAMRREFRKTDLLARLGGEEFVVMMPETTPANATVKIDRFVSYIAEHQFNLPKRGADLRMTISVGVAGVPGDVEDPARLLEVADARLLAAKRAGRNRVVGAGVQVGRLT
jgi:two-component system, cell cycle response regulator